MAATSELRPTTELKINLDKLKSRVREYIDKVILNLQCEVTIMCFLLGFAMPYCRTNQLSP